MKRKMITLIGLILIISVLSKIGVISEYNYFTAQYYKLTDKARVVGYYGENPWRGLDWEQYQFLVKKYDFTKPSVKRENYNKFEQRGIESFNKQMELYLNKRDGKDWKERYNKDVDSILRLNYHD